ALEGETAEGKSEYGANKIGFRGKEGADTKPAELAAKRRKDMTKALSLGRQSIKSLEPVDKETTNAAAPHRLHQPIAGFVEQPLSRWLPDNFNVTLLAQPLDWQLPRIGLVQDSRRSPVAPEANAGSLSIPLAKEMPPHR